MTDVWTELEAWGRRFAALVAVFCPLLITYSNTVKQYSFELLVSVVLLLMLERAIRSTPGAAPSLGLAAAGLLGPWLSLSSVFILAVGWMALAHRAGREQVTRRWLMPVTVCWATSAALAYVTVYRPASRNPYMRHFWELAFIQPGRSGFFVHLWKSLEDLVWGSCRAIP